MTIDRSVSRRAACRPGEVPQAMMSPGISRHVAKRESRSPSDGVPKLV
jgi:hypothetical protein